MTELSILFWERTFKFCARKAMECSMLRELFCENLEDKVLRTVQTMEAFEVSMGNLRLSGDICNFQ